uniref:Uncharacterized protein n=1 Tax=Bubo bubo TaxID=30461 RepID=A0A8C0I9Q4_BUBBB
MFTAASLLAFMTHLKRKERENGKGTRENGMKRAVLLALSLDLRICHMLRDVGRIIRVVVTRCETNQEIQLQQKMLKWTLCSCSAAEVTPPL